MNTTAIRGCRWSLVYASREGIWQDAGETWEECLDAAQEMFRERLECFLNDRHGEVPGLFGVVGVVVFR